MSVQQSVPGPWPVLEARPASRRWIPSWFVGEVLVPFLATRSLLFLAGWFAEVLVANPRYPQAHSAAQGYIFTPLRWLDMWVRWDAGWYMQIALKWYGDSFAYRSAPTQVAYFPFFPTVLRGIMWLLPGDMHNARVGLVLGLLISNAALLVGLVALRKLTATCSGVPAGRRAVLYALTFPTGYFLSAFYPESLFLASSTVACLLGSRSRWLPASLAGAVAALSRPYGVMVVLPLVWFYCSSHGWKITKVRLDALYILLIPAALAVFLILAYPLTKDFLGPYRAQAGWRRHFSSPWVTLTNGMYFEGTITRIGQSLAVVVPVLLLWSFKLLRSGAFGLYALAITLPSLMSGTLMGFGRHVAVVFPLYMVLGALTERESVHRYLQALGLALQILFMAAWCRFYPVV